MAQEKYAIDVDNQQAYYLQPQYNNDNSYLPPKQNLAPQQEFVQQNEPPPASYYETRSGLKIHRRVALYFAVAQFLLSILVLVHGILYVTLGVPFNYYQDFWTGAFMLISGLITVTAARRAKLGLGIAATSLALCLLCTMLAVSGVVLISVLLDWSLVFKEVCLGRRPDRYMRMYNWQKQEMLVKCHVSKIPYDYHWVMYVIDLVMFVVEVLVSFCLAILYSKTICCRSSSTY